MWKTRFEFWNNVKTWIFVVLRIILDKYLVAKIMHLCKQNLQSFVAVKTFCFTWTAWNDHFPAILVRSLLCSKPYWKEEGAEPTYLARNMAEIFHLSMTSCRLDSFRCGPLFGWGHATSIHKYRVHTKAKFNLLTLVLHVLSRAKAYLHGQVIIPSHLEGYGKTWRGSHLEDWSSGIQWQRELWKQIWKTVPRRF